MIPVKGYAAPQAKAALSPFDFQRREPGPRDVLIDIKYCGICHSDIHQVRDEWGRSLFPMVPGHEIVGHVEKVGAHVTKFKVGDSVGVGCMVDSCRECGSCKDGLEQFCEHGMVGTYNAKDKEGNPTYGGYSTKITVDENYVLRVPKNIDLAAAAPLLCAGITTYSPLRHWGVKRGDRIGVIGLGGLGHMAVKLAAAMGAEVTVFSTSPKKKESALELGAKHFIVTKEAGVFEKHANTFDLIINSVSAEIDLNAYLRLLKRDKTLVLLGVPEKPAELSAFSLIGGRRRLAGSLIGGIAETQEMLDFCGEHGIGAEIEKITMDKVNESFDRVNRSDVRYRFVIDINASF